MATADAFDWFADWAEGTSPLYAVFSHRIQDDDALLDVASETRDDQPPPHLLFASVHALLLDGADTPLREYYPSVADDPRAPDDRAYDLFREFVLDNEAAIRRLVSTRRTQTNAVRRCAALYPAFRWIAENAASGPLALLELGPSAGLNLRWDAYRYRYRRDGEADRVVGKADSPVTIDSTIRAGDPPLPADPPPVVERLGIDIAPLDVTNDEDVTWLRALVWPEHTDRHALLEDAIPAVRDDPPEIVQGDAVERLPELVGRLPADATRVVYNTQVLYQLTDDERDRIRAHIRESGRDQPLYWISGEGAHPDYDESIELTITHSADGELEERLVAAYQQHGRWVAWPE